MRRGQIGQIGFFRIEHISDSNRSQSIGDILHVVHFQKRQCHLQLCTLRLFQCSQPFVQQLSIQVLLEFNRRSWILLKKILIGMPNHDERNIAQLVVKRQLNDLHVVVDMRVHRNLVGLHHLDGHFFLRVVGECLRDTRGKRVHPVCFQVHGIGEQEHRARRQLLVCQRMLDQIVGRLFCLAVDSHGFCVRVVLEIARFNVAKTIEIAQISRVQYLIPARAQP
mmetsp:Transcript_61386/g.97749  ORF Transcript_61386/g.97749 Transcript_61386/m.97749 type:complete len:223 (+) Transcript_61386:657-1325(+)